MPFELFVALRYLRDGRLQTALILAGIAVAVGVVIFLSALITGLQDSLIARTLGSQPLVVIRPPEEVPRSLAPDDGRLDLTRVERPAQRVRSIDQWQTTASALRSRPGVSAVAPTVTGPAIALRGAGSVSVSVRGIQPETYDGIVDVQGSLVAGSLDLEGLRAAVGTGLAEALGIDVGGRIRLRVDDDPGAVYTVSGIFELGSSEADEALVLVSLRSAQTLFALPGGVSALEVRNLDVFRADELAESIVDRTGLDAESWIDRNRDLLVGLRSQSLSSWMIQTFVVIAVALGIASVLMVSVVQRSPEIGILRATGSRSGTVTRIFLLQGAILGLVGSVLGIALGSGLAWLFQGLARNPDGSATFPVALTTWLYARSVGIAMIVGTLAALTPARKAARMDPATVIRDG